MGHHLFLELLAISTHFLNGDITSATWPTSASCTAALLVDAGAVAINFGRVLSGKYVLLFLQFVTS